MVAARVALVAVALFAATACKGDGDKGTSADSTTSTPATSPATSSAQPTSTVPSPTTTAERSPLRVRGDTGRGEFLFRSPSSNIWCRINDTSAVCEIGEKSWQPPPQPPDCKYPTWGSVLVVDARTARFVCSDHSVAEEDGPELPYGGVIERGNVRCRSEADAMECEHRAGGTKFRLSKAEYETS